MKKVFALMLGVVFLASCNSKPDGYTITGTVEGDLENGTMVYLKTTDSLNQVIDIDTTTIENGSFSFSGDQAEPKLHYLFMESNNGNVSFILENEEIDIQFQKDSMNYAKLSGTVQNDFYMSYMKEFRKLSERASSMQNDMRTAAQRRDTATVFALREEFMEFQEQAKSFNIDFAKQNPNSLISIFIIGDLITAKAISNDEAKEMYEALTPEMKATKSAKKLKERLDSMKSTEVGAVAPDFSAPTPSGETLALSEVTNKGKLTLVDFWAAWCRPCRMENPNIVSVYNKYKDKGFNVIGVSLDTSSEDWKRAIESDGLDWNHISNLKRFQDPIAELYGVNAIPAAFLLDENGVIVARNLRGPALEEKVAELLN